MKTRPSFPRAENFKISFVLFALVSLCQLSFAQMVSPGTYNTLWICEDGSLTGSGTNTYGIMCDANYLPNTLPPPQLGLDNDWLMVACGAYHTLLLKEDHTLWACGSNTTGALGIGDLPNQLDPVQVGDDEDWAFIEAGDYCSFAIKEDGSLWSWGQGLNGTLGLGFDLYQTNVPVQIGLDKGWASISVQNTSCTAIKKSGELWCWGENGDGQLGVGNYINAYTPTFVVSPDSVRFVASGGAHTIVIDDKQRAYACGNNMDGKFGIGASPTFSDTLMLIDPLNKYIYAACGGSFTILLRDDGTLWSAGTNINGQLGIGGFESVNVLTQVGTDDDWVKVEAGAFHAVGVKADNSYRIWGNNQFFQLGVSSFCDGITSCSEPQEIDGLCGSDVGIAEQQQNSFIIYPNPIENKVLQLDVSGLNKGPVICVIWDMTGRKIYEETLGSGRFMDIPLPNLTSGSYIATLQSENIPIARATFILQ